MDKDGNCVLYEEVHNGVDLSGTNGDFSFDLGYGTSKINNVDGSNSLKSNIFRNDVNVSASITCPGGVTVAAGDPRRVRVQYDVNGGTGYSTLTPDLRVLGTPYSVVAETLQGKASSDFVQIVNDGTHALTQANVENVFSSTNYPRLKSLLDGTTSVDFNNQRLVNVANPTAAQDAATKNYADTNLGGKTVDVTGVGVGSGDKYTLSWDQAAQKWVAALPNDTTKLPLAGGTMTGPIAMGAQNITNIGHMTIATQRTLGLGSFTDAQEATLIATPLVAADAGKFWYNSDHGVLKVWNGSTAVAQAYTNGSGQLPASQLPSSVVLDGGNPATAAMNIGNNGNFALNFKTNNATVMTLDNSGKVGIGTTSPIAKLHVAGGQIFGGQGIVTNQQYGFGDNTSYFDGVTTGASSYLRTVVNNSEVMRLLATGNVGIGTTTPVASLDVLSNNTATSGSANIGAANLTTNYQPSTAPAAGTNINNVFTWMNTLSTANLSNVTALGGNYTLQHLGGSNINTLVGFQAATAHGGTGTASQVAAGQYIINNNSTGTISNANGLTISMTNTGGGTITNAYGLQIGALAGTNKWGVYQTDATAKNYFAGNVGVGTATPTAGTILDLAGTGATKSSILLPRDTTANRPATGVNGMMRYNSSTDRFEGYEGGAWVNVTSTGSGTGDFKKDGSVAMTGNLQLNNNWLSNDGGNNGIRIDNSGRVGIGTTTANAMLTVMNSTGSGTTLASSGTTDATMNGRIGRNVSATDFGTLDDGTGWMQVRNTGGLGSTFNLALNPKGGNVAIGTTIPNAALDVRGALASAAVPANIATYDTATMAADVGGGIAFGGNYGAGIQATFAGVRGGKNNATANDYGGYLSFMTRANGGNLTEKIRIDSSGNVGIGTTTPTAGTILDLTGTGAAKSSVLLPRDTTANRPATGVNGMLRYNSSIDQFEGYAGGSWISFASTGGASSGQNASGSLTYNSNSDGVGNDGGFNFQSNGTDLITVSNSGDTAITSTTASTSATTGALTVAGGLGVAGKIFSNNTIVGAKFSASSSGANNIPYNMYLSTGGTDSKYFDWFQQASQLDLRLLSDDYMSSTVAMSLKRSGMTLNSVSFPNGNIGIGTTFPENKLTVNGTIATTQFPTTSPTLNGAITSGATSLVLSNATGFPPSGLVYMPSEVIQYTSISGNTLNGLTRGMFGTTAAAHANGDTVYTFRIFSPGPNSTQVGGFLSLNNNATIIGTGESGGPFGGNSLTVGFNSRGTGAYTLAVGDGARAVGMRSVATGVGVFANGWNSLATGNNLSADSFSEVVGGQYNKPTGSETTSIWVNTDPLFVLGNGTGAGATANALMVFKNGQTLVNGGATVALPAANVSLTTMGTTTNNTAAAFNATDSAGSSKLFVRNDGNVGIGTTTPSNNLEVAAADASPSLMVQNTTSTTGRWPTIKVRNYQNGVGSGHSIISMQNSGGTAAAPSALSGSLVIGAFSYQGATGAGNFGTAAAVSAYSSAGYTATSSPGELRFSTTPTGSTNPTDRMIIDSTGNVGIGTSSPLSAMHVAGGTGITWNGTGLSSGLVTIGSGANAGGSLFVNTPSFNDSANYNSGLGVTGTYNSPTKKSVINLNGYGVNAATYSSDMALSTTSGSTLSEVMRLTSGGNVGIGTSSPTNRLDVLGDLTIGSSTAGIGSRINFRRGFDGSPSGFAGFDTSATLQLQNSSGMGAGIDLSNSGYIAFKVNSYSTERMRIDAAGNVGIGTTTPLAPLHVGNSTASATMGASYLVSQGSSALQNSNGGSYATSILAESAIISKYAVIAGVVSSISDERVKQIQGISKSAEDLETLKKIQITDYKYIDEFKMGSNIHKKVIAQQVEKVMPEAVLKRADFLPNIYAPAKRVEYRDGKAIVTLANWKPVKVGEKIRFYNEKNELMDAVVTEVRAPSFSVEGLSEAKAGNKLFVYGKEVNDFRSVDYDAISMLNVSATQELAKQFSAEIERQKKENAELRAAVCEINPRAKICQLRTPAAK